MPALSMRHRPEDLSIMPGTANLELQWTLSPPCCWEMRRGADRIDRWGVTQSDDTMIKDWNEKMKTYCRLTAFVHAGPCVKSSNFFTATLGVHALKGLP